MSTNVRDEARQALDELDRLISVVRANHATPSSRRREETAERNLLAGLFPDHDVSDIELSDGRAEQIEDLLGQADLVEGIVQRANGTLSDHEHRRAAEAVEVARRVSTGGPAEARAETETGLAERLIDRHGNDLLHVPGLGWLAWDGRRWARDGSGEIDRRVKDSVRAIRQELPGLEGDEFKRRARYAVGCEKAATMRAAISIARSDLRVVLAATRLDAHEALLCCNNGTIDLRTGEMREHRRDDLITRTAPVDHDPDATDPRWDRFIDDITGGDDDLAAYLARVAGYTLTGSTREETLFLLHGRGATGKSTFVDAIRAVMGDHAVVADFETFLRRRDSGGPRSGLAQLAGARLAVASEVDDGRRLAEGLVKALSGGDTIRASFLYADSFEFRPNFKLWLVANHAPIVDDQDDAIWRRIQRVPLDHVVPAERRDTGLKHHLRRPSPAVLAWAVRGCLDWQQQGLAPPTAVRAATDEYRSAQDPVADFLDEWCHLRPDARTASRDLTAAWEAWCTRQGQEPVRGRALADRLRTHGLEQGRDRALGRHWIGVELLHVEDRP